MKKILVVFVLIMIAGAFLMYKFFGDVGSYQGDLSSPQEVKALKTFIDTHDDEHIVLSLTLTEKMAKEFAEGMKKSPSVLLAVPNPDNESIMSNYVIQQMEGGKQEFIFDEKSRILEGLFKNTKKVTANGKVFIYLQPMNPAKLKENSAK